MQGAGLSTFSGIARCSVSDSFPTLPYSTSWRNTTPLGGWTLAFSWAKETSGRRIARAGSRARIIEDSGAGVLQNDGIRMMGEKPKKVPLACIDFFMILLS